jgi:uncharacterized protein YhhL (DUF1145 family)
MANPPPVTVTLRLRARYMLTGAIMLAFWGASLVALFRGVDGLHILMVVVTTVSVLPLGVIILLGAVSGSEASMWRAQMALLASGCLLLLIVSAEVIRRIVFGAGG